MQFCWPNGRTAVCSKVSLYEECMSLDSGGQSLAVLDGDQRTMCRRRFLQIRPHAVGYNNSDQDFA